MSGTPAQIGPYRIDRELGRGGMGVVYLGHDPRLGRKVAIKALPEHLAHDPERLARFEREARLLASLTHPNIAGVYGLEETGGGRYLVMEYVEGPTLAAALSRGALALDEALRIAAQVASGVEAAHEAGVIHRDLKPGNIIVTADGKAKVLDFGLAKEVEGRGSSLDLSRSPTMTSPPPAPSHHTQAGQIMGTAAYLSPEQARGKRIDRRTDIWAFGCVLFEMLTGASPYRGETITDSLGAILHKDPEWERLPADTPPAVRHLLRRCLTKDAERRLRDIGDARIEIEEFLRDPSASRIEFASAAPSESAARRAGSSRVAWGAVAALALVSAALGWASWSASRRAPEPVRRLTIGLNAGDLFPDFSNRHFAISPDGATIVVVVRSAGETPVLAMRSMDSFVVTPRPGTDMADQPFFSPDGAWVGYFANGRLMKVAIGGGSPVTICELPAGSPRGATWTDDDRIVFSPSTSDGLFIVPAGGGEPTPLTTLRPEERSHRWPHALPGSKAVLFTAQDLGADFTNSTIEAVRLDGGDRVVLHRGGSNPVYARSGHLLFGRSDGVFGARFDAAALRLDSAPTPVLENVSFAPPNGGLSLAVSNDGVLVYELGQGDDFISRLSWSSRTGDRELILGPISGAGAASLSPDGRRIAVQVFRLEDGGHDLWTLEIDRAVMTRLTFDSGDELGPIWSPDGREIVYTSVKRGAFPSLALIGADGSNQRKISEPSEAEFVSDWTDDGTLVLKRYSPESEYDIWTRPLDDPSGGAEFLSTPFEDVDAVVSPDGAWIAYSSAASDRPEVFIRPFDGRPGRWQISAEGGRHPLWAPDGSEIYYFANRAIYAAPVRLADGSVEVGAPARLFDFTPAYRDYPFFAVHPDGDRFMLLETDQSAEAASDAELAVTLNWFQELRERTGR